MIWKRTAVLSAFAFGTFVIAASTSNAQTLEPPENPIWTRSDCMVRIDHKEPADKGEEYPELGAFMDFVFRYAADNLMPFSLGGGRPGRGTFLTYFVRCDEKYKFTELMIDKFLADNPGYFESISVSREKLSPNFGVHVSCGPWWSDGNVGCE